MIYNKIFADFAKQGIKQNDLQICGFVLQKRVKLATNKNIFSIGHINSTNFFDFYD